jgi:hypothetical protein
MLARGHLLPQKRWWVVTHEHSSVPFEMESGRASLDVKPQDMADSTGTTSLTISNF